MSYFTPTSRSSQQGRQRHRSRGKRRASAEGGAWARFKADLRDVRERYIKRTSAEHKRLVLLLIVLGAVIRAVLMLRPITADEALAFITFSQQPIGGLLSDYSLPLNHVLHSLLAKWSTGLFGTSAFTLRLPAAVFGVLVLPIYYLFVRSMFNRYIAIMALALAAVFPAQAEASALGHGHSITWFAFVMALVLGRHLTRENNPWTALFLGAALALGMWAMPLMIFPALAVLLWLLFSLMGKYERSLNERLAMLGVAAGAFLVLTVLLYLPIVLAHGVDQLLHHLADARLPWKAFRAGYHDKVLDLWLWITDPVTGWVGLFGFIALVHAAYISVKFRMLLLALVLGAVPLTLVLRDTGDPERWSYALMIFHIGSAIALFYLLKLVQDKVIASFAKRARTVLASLAIAMGFGATTLLNTADRDPYGRMVEAAPAAEYLRSAMAPGDRLCAAPRWEHALRFELLAQGMDADRENGPLESGQTVFAALVAPSGPGLDLTLLRCGIPIESLEEPRIMRDWPRLEIFAARKR